MKRETVTITTPFIKLDALLKFSGIAGTGGHAKLLVTQGEVKVDDAVCTQRGRKITPGTRVVLPELAVEIEVLAGED